MFRLLRRLIRWIYRKRLIETWQAGYEVGIKTGFSLGKKMMTADQTNMGFIISSTPTKISLN